MTQDEWAELSIGESSNVIKVTQTLTFIHFAKYQSPWKELFHVRSVKPNTFIKNI